MKMPPEMAGTVTDLAPILSAVSQQMSRGYDGNVRSTSPVMAVDVLYDDGEQPLCGSAESGFEHG